MDTLSDPSARTAPADDGLPRILRDDGPIAKRLPAVWETLARVWQRYVPDAEDRPRWGDLWVVLLLAASTIYLVGRDGGRPRGAAFLREGLWEQLGGIAPLLVLAIGHCSRHRYAHQPPFPSRLQLIHARAGRSPTET